MPISLGFPFQTSLALDAGVKKKRDEKTVPAARRLPAILPSAKTLLESPKGKAIADTMRERTAHCAYENLRPKVYRLAYETRAIEQAPELFHKMQQADGKDASITAKDIPMRKVPAAEELLGLLGETPDAEIASKYSRGIFQRSGMIMAQAKREEWGDGLAGEIRKAAAMLRILAVMHNAASMGRLDGFVSIYKFYLPKKAKMDVAAARMLLSDPRLKEAARMAEAILSEGREAQRPVVKKKQLDAQLEFSICPKKPEVAAQASPTAIAFNDVLADSKFISSERWVSHIEKSLLGYQAMGLKLKESGIVPVLAAAAEYLRNGDYVGFHAHYSEVKKRGGGIAELAAKEMGPMNGIIIGQIERICESLSAASKSMRA